jgi:hypothetical protein
MRRSLLSQQNSIIVLIDDWMDDIHRLSPGMRAWSIRRPGSSPHQWGGYDEGPSQQVTADTNSLLRSIEDHAQGTPTTNLGMRI